MIHAISIHALERLHERRNLVHLIRHVHKMQKWERGGMPETGTFTHKGYRYITRDGVLVTVLPPRRKEVKMRPAGINRKLTEYEIAEVKEVYRDVKSYAETGRSLNISAGVVSQIIRRKGRFGGKK